MIHDVLRGEVELAPRDLLPWADPYITKLAAKYRLQAALDDSVRYLADEFPRSHVGADLCASDRHEWRTRFPDTHRGERYGD